MIEKHLTFMQELGFNSFEQFKISLLRPNLLNITLPIAAIGPFVEMVFGLKTAAVIAFVALLTVELVSGIFASWTEGQKITSKRMKAFLMMLFVWLVVLFILNTFKRSFEGQDIHTVFEYLFNAVLLFVTSIYFKSIWENAGRIMGKKDEFKNLISIFGKKSNTNDSQ